MDAEAEATLRAQVEGQRGEIADLKIAFEASEARQRKDQADVLQKLGELLAKSSAGRESGGQATVGAAGGFAAPSTSSAHSGGGGVRAGGEGVAAEADSHQLGGGGPAGDYVPQGEQSSNDTPGGSAGEGRLHHNIMLKNMKIPKLKRGVDIESWSRECVIFMKMNKFDGVFFEDPYINVGSIENNREYLIGQGVSGDMYDRQMAAYMFLSQALESEVDRGIFYRSESPREAWEKLHEYYGPKTNEQKRVLQLKMSGFKMKAGEDPVQALFELDALQEKMERAHIPIDTDTKYTHFLNGLPKSEFEQEQRDIGLMETYDREEIVRLVHNRYETLKRAREEDQANKTADAHALACVEQGRSRVQRPHHGKSSGGRGGGRRSGRENGDDGKAAGGRRNMDGVICWRCRAKGHYSDNCTIKLCDRCGGRGHDMSSCPTPVIGHAGLILGISEEDSDEEVIAAGF